jgi:RNA polymerase sigma-70 factor (ECF subfamily)
MGTRRPGKHGDDHPLSCLAERAKSGDGGAFQELLLELTRYVGWAIRQRLPAMVAREYEVDDVAGLVWIALLENFARLEIRGDGPLRAWVRRLVESRILDLEAKLKAQRRDSDRRRSLDQMLASGDDEATPPELRSDDAAHVRALWSRIEIAQVVAALHLMPPEQAAALWTVDFDGCSLREASALLETPFSTVRERYHKARARLARIVSDERRDSA